MSFRTQPKQIELGGGYATYSASNLIKSPSRPNLPLPSRESLESSHKLSQKMSPTKNVVSPLMKKHSTFNENDYSTKLDHSQLSK